MKTLRNYQQYTGELPLPFWKSAKNWPLPFYKTMTLYFTRKTKKLEEQQRKLIKMMTKNPLQRTNKCGNLTKTRFILPEVEPIIRDPIQAIKHKIYNIIKPTRERSPPPICYAPPKPKTKKKKVVTIQKRRRSVRIAKRKKQQTANNNNNDIMDLDEDDNNSIDIDMEDNNNNNNDIHDNDVDMHDESNNNNNNNDDNAINNNNSNNDMDNESNNNNNTNNDEMDMDDDIIIMNNDNNNTTITTTITTTNNNNNNNNISNDIIMDDEKAFEANNDFVPINTGLFRNEIIGIEPIKMNEFNYDYMCASCDGFTNDVSNAICTTCDKPAIIYCQACNVYGCAKCQIASIQQNQNTVPRNAHLKIPTKLKGYSTYLYGWVGGNTWYVDYVTNAPLKNLTVTTFNNNVEQKKFIGKCYSLQTQMYPVIYVNGVQIFNRNEANTQTITEEDFWFKNISYNNNNNNNNNNVTAEELIMIIIIIIIRIIQLIRLMISIIEQCEPIV